MTSHGYNNDYDDFDMVEAEYESYAMRRAPHQNTVHMTQQMTTKVAPAYDGRTSFFAFEDAIDDWCDITERLRKEVLHYVTDSREMPLNTNVYLTEINSETQ